MIFLEKKFTPRGAGLAIILSLVFFALYFIFQVLSVFVVSLFVSNALLEQMSVQLSIIANCVTVLAFALIYRLASLSFAKSAHLNKIPPRFYFNSVIMGAATSFAIALILGLIALSGILPDSWVSTQNDAYSDVTAASSLLKFLSVGLTGPLVEELLFRGLILGTLKENMHPWLAISLSAILFGVVHATPIGIIYATFLGLLMGWLFVRFNSVLPAIVFHMAYNCTVAYSGEISLPVAILAIPILIFEIIDINRYFRGKQK